MRAADLGPFLSWVDNRVDIVIILDLSAVMWTMVVTHVPGVRWVDIRKKMKRDWDRRAKIDPLYWVAATQEADEKSYHESAAKDAQALLDGLRGRVDESGHVLDLGCGIGRMTAPIAQSFARVVGVDVSSEMIDQAKLRHSDVDNLEFAVNDGTGLGDFENASFDLVFSYSVLPHLPPEVVRSYFHEVNRILKPGGWFRYQFWVGPERTQAANDTLNIRVYSPEDFQELNRNAGFELHEIDEIDYFDPVLQIRPIWANVQRVGDAQSIVEIEGNYTDDFSDDERELETNLLIYLAQKHAERGENDDAERVLQEAISSDPDRPEGYLEWAQIRVQKGDIKGALKLFKIVTERIPDLSAGWLFRAQAEEQLNRKGKAVKSLRMAEEKDVHGELAEHIAELKEHLKI